MKDLYTTIIISLLLILIGVVVIYLNSAWPLIALIAPLFIFSIQSQTNKKGKL